MDKITWSDIQDAHSWDSEGKDCKFTLKPDLSLDFRCPPLTIQDQSEREGLEILLKSKAHAYFMANQEKLMNGILNFNQGDKK